MSKRKKCPDRRRTALRRCAWLAAILLFLAVTKLYTPLPGMAVAEAADVCDVKNPEVVDWFYDGTLPITRFSLHALVDGERSMMLTAVTFNPLAGGWYYRTFSEAEAWDGSGLYAGVYQHGQDEKNVGYLFGRIDDPNIVSVELTETVQAVLVPESGLHPDDEVTLPVTLKTEPIVERNGGRYLLAEMELRAEPYSTRGFQLTGYDAEGNAVVTIEPYWRYWHT